MNKRPQKNETGDRMWGWHMFGEKGIACVVNKNMQCERKLLQKWNSIARHEGVRRRWKK